MSGVMMEILNYEGGEPGPVLVVLGGVHGNEPGGSAAIRDIESLLETGALKLNAGELILIPEVNRKALQENVRYIDRDLNRRLGEIETPSCHEDYVANEICPVLRQADVLLDLHGYKSGTEPFVFLGEGNPAEKAFARSLGPSHFCWNFQAATDTATGNKSHSIGTTEYTRAHNGYGVTLECGHYQDVKATARIGKEAILNALSHLGMANVSRETYQEQNIKHHFVKLTQSVIKKRAGELTRKWAHLDKLARNTVIARYEDGQEISAQEESYILLPDAEAEIGTNWFYLGIEQEP